MKKVDILKLKEYLDYDSNTGIFVWKERSEHNFKTKRAFKCWDKRYSNTAAGSMSNKGYIRISIDKERYLAHRLAFAFVNMRMPNGQLDHIDRIKHHNWIDNLRETDNVKNSRNCSVSVANKTGITGVCYANKAKRWRATIKVNYINISLGDYDEFESAVKARFKGEVKYGFFNINKTSPSFEYLKEINADVYKTPRAILNEILPETKKRASGKNKTGVLGVRYNKKNERWVAQITPNKKQIHLGSFHNESDAVMARWQAEKKYKTNKDVSNSVAYDYLCANGIIHNA